MPKEWMGFFGIEAEVSRSAVGQERAVLSLRCNNCGASVDYKLAGYLITPATTAKLIGRGARKMVHGPPCTYGSRVRVDWEVVGLPDGAQQALVNHKLDTGDY